MLLTLAFLLVYLTMMLHFSNRLYALTLTLLDDARTMRMRKEVDWKHTENRRRPRR